MSYQATTFVIGDERIRTPSELAVMLAIANYADHEGRAYPGVNTIAKDARLKRRRTQDILHELELRGVIRIGRKASQYGTNKYQIRGMP
jgi:DNA-binding transcriptional regulator YhcF (GntR family)